MKKYLVFITLFISFTKIHAACRNCNVILISLDTVGAKHVGLYNSSKKLTPNIDAFGNQARVYQNAYSSSSWTLPGHASMLTGRYHWQMNVFSPDSKVPEDAVTVAEALKSNGYDTAAFVDGLLVSRAFGFNQGFDVFDEKTKNIINKDFDVKMKKVNAWMDSRKSKKPFFLFIHTYDAHEPFKPSEEALRQLPQMPSKKFFNLEEIISILKLKEPKFDFDYVTQLYEAGLYDVDKKLGEFFQKLKTDKLMQNTVVILTADHGEELGEHGNWAVHGFQLYNEVLHVPLIYYAPNSVVKKIKSPVSLVDIMPTILNEVGIASKERFDGMTLPILDKEDSLTRPIFSEVSFDQSDMVKGLDFLARRGKPSLPAKLEPLKKDSPAIAALKTDAKRRYSLIFNNKKMIFNKHTGEIHSYNLEQDPDEKTPLPFSCNQLECQIQNLFIFKSGALK